MDDTCSPTMAIEAYPVGSDSGFSEESAISSEQDRLISALGGRMSDFIVDPFDGMGNGEHFGESHSASSYDITIDPSGVGVAFMGGHLVDNNSPITLTLDGSATNEIFLIVADSETGNANVVFTSDGSTPSGQYVMKIWEAATDGSGVTGTTDFRKYTPFQDGAATEDSVTGRKTGTSGTVDISTTGIQTVDVTFQNPYRESIDQVIVQVADLTDNSAGFGFWRSINRTTDGFTIEVDVDKSGGAGETCTFDWIAQGK